MAYQRLMQPKFGDRLKEWLRAAGLSVNKAALLSGVDQSQLNKITNNKLDVTDEVIAQLAPYLPVTIREMKAAATAGRLGEEGVDLIWEHILKPRVGEKEVLDMVRNWPRPEQRRLLRRLEAWSEDPPKDEGEDGGS